MNFQVTDTITTQYRLFIFVVATLLLFFVFAPKVHAATVELTVNGGSSAAVTNGQSVELAWYIDGSVSSCVINNGVGPIDTSSLPASGSITVTPPESATVDYNLTCNGGSSVATVAINPIVTLTVNNPTEELDRITGEADLTVEWTSRYATQCTRVWFERSSSPSTQVWTTSYSDQYDTSGSVSFTSSNAQPAITEDSTFYIECENVVTGTKTTASASLTVSNPSPLPAPTVNISATGPTVITRDSITALAETQLQYTSNYTDECSFQAYYLDGTPYAALPEDFDAYGYTTDQTDGIFWWVGIYESTRFEVTCTQLAYTIGATNYPEVSVTDDIIIQVNPPLPLDRTGLPQVTVTATALSNPVYEDAITGYAQVPVHIVTENAESCSYSAYGITVDGWPTSRADGWWGQNPSGSKDEVILVNINIGTTTLYGTCERTYDTTNFSPGDPEYEAAIANVELTIVALPSVGLAPDPQAFIYGNAEYLNAWDIWDTSTNRSGFGMNAGMGAVTSFDPSLRSPSGGGGSNLTVNGSVTFPFVSPDKDSDTYDLIVKYCDENDGFNDFTLTTESGFSASWRSDSTSQYSTWCSGNDEEVTRVVGSDVTLQDGELITITCNNAADPIKNEQCILMGLAVGQNNGGTVTEEVATSTGFATAPIFWGSRYADDCSSPVAVAANGSSYNYTSDTPKDLFTTNDISTTTTFSITCDRDGIEDTASIEVQALTGAEVVSATTSIEVYECYDPAIPGVRDAEPWEWANPSNSNFCEPAVDLNALAPSISFADAIADNVAGLYDSIEALIAIENLGPGPLSSGNEIQFLGRLNIQSVIAALFGISNPVETVSTPGFSDGLGTSTDSVTPVLTRTYDGVPFGDHTLCARINIDGGDNFIFTEWNPDTTNNSVCTSVTLPVPPPPMSISAAREIIRSGQSVDITWTAHTSYPLNCTVLGPGGINSSFDASDNAPNPVSVVQSTTPLTSTGKFKLTCNEPITNTTFTEELTVEVVPEQQEV
jgi:hypothetical protein